MLGVFFNFVAVDDQKIFAAYSKLQLIRIKLVIRTILTFYLIKKTSDIADLRLFRVKFTLLTSRMRIFPSVAPRQCKSLTTEACLSLDSTNKALSLPN